MRLSIAIRNGFISLCLASLILLLKTNHNFFLFCEPADQEEHFFHPDDMLKRKLQTTMGNQSRAGAMDHNCVPLFSRTTKPRVKLTPEMQMDLPQKVVKVLQKENPISKKKKEGLVAVVPTKPSKKEMAIVAATTLTAVVTPNTDTVPAKKQDRKETPLDMLKDAAKGKQKLMTTSIVGNSSAGAMIAPLLQLAQATLKPLLTIKTKREVQLITTESKVKPERDDKPTKEKPKTDPSSPSVSTVGLLVKTVGKMMDDASKTSDSLKDLLLLKSVVSKEIIETHKNDAPSNNKKQQQLEDSGTPAKIDSWSSSNAKKPEKQTQPSNPKTASTAELPKEKTEMNPPAQKVSTVQESATKVEKLAASSSKDKKPVIKPTTANDKPMNILILYPDDWRHDSIGAAGTQPVLTPFLDSFAKEGIRFTHNCVTTSICWISRATLATGQYLARHKSESVKNPIFYKYWNETWQGLLRDNGYYTGHIGKWQYRNYSFVEDHHDFTRLYEGTHWVQKRGERKIAATDACRNDTIEFLRGRPKDKPFALTVAFYPPKAVGSASEQWFPKKETRMLYDNITIPEPKDWNASYYKLPEFFRIKNEARNRWNQRYRTSELYQNSMKNYYALITQVDEACKDIVDEIKAQGLLDNTLIIFTTDNGLFHGEHGLAGKWFPYQESIRVPLIIRDPRMPKSKFGTLDDSYTLNIDLAPTVIGATKLPMPSRIQGRDMSDIYLLPDAKQSWRQEFYYEHPSLGSKYIPASTALVRKDFKYMYYREFRTEQLFNLAVDPLETEDLSNRTEHATLLKEMREKHNEYKEIVK